MPRVLTVDGSVKIGAYRLPDRDKRLQAAERSDREKKVAACKAAYYQANKEKIAARRKERRDAEKRRGGDGEADGPGAADAGAGVHTAEAGA